ncbi:hypothetical protein AKJ16_DCAP05704 [Drosera capensis]
MARTNFDLPDVSYKISRLTDIRSKSEDRVPELSTIRLDAESQRRAIRGPELLATKMKAFYQTGEVHRDPCVQKLGVETLDLHSPIGEERGEGIDVAAVKDDGGVGLYCGGLIRSDLKQREMMVPKIVADVIALVSLLGISSNTLEAGSSTWSDDGEVARPQPALQKREALRVPRSKESDLDLRSEEAVDRLQSGKEQREKGDVAVPEATKIWGETVIWVNVVIRG